MYKLQDYDIVSLVIKEHYDEFLTLMGPPAPSKLAFLKLLKDYSGLGLKDAKINSDVIFAGGIEKFKNSFGLKEIRKNKLEQLKVRLFTRELAEIIQNKSEDELVEILSKLQPTLLEVLLEIFLND